MSRLNEIIAIEKGEKSRALAAVTKILNSDLKKADLFNGLDRQYHPLNDDGDKLPAESKIVQHTVDNLMSDTRKILTRLMNVTARKEWANTTAKANIVIDGETILSEVPVTYLLFLEKQLVDIHTIVSNIPVLDPAEKWSYDRASGHQVTPVIKTHRTKKTPKAIVKYPATVEHPAQTELYNEDIIVGYWHMTKQSGAWEKPKRDALKERVETLMNAVKEARERANNIEEGPRQHAGEAIFGYLFG